MDDVETGYYLQLESNPEMVRKEVAGEKDHVSSSESREDLEVESVNSEEFLDSVNDIYGLDRGKTKLYKEFFRLYTDRQDQETVLEEDSFEKSRFRSKVFLWLLIVLLVSNPVIGGYNLYHFSNYPSHFDSLPLKPTESSVAQKSQVNERKWYNLKLFKNTEKGEGGNKSKGTVEDEETFGKEFLRSTAIIGKKVSRYCFYEVFGEIIFGVFSLLLMSLCKLPCNNSNSIRYMIPTLFMFYMIIYRLLAFYILITSLKILFYSLALYKPVLLNKLPSFLTYLLTFRNLDLYNPVQVKVLRRLFDLDSFGLKMLLVFSLENVYITCSESLELFGFVLKILVSAFKKKVLKKSELNFYSSTDYNNSKLFKNCFSRDTFSSSDPHEKYIHSLYNYASDIGTYLKNIDIRDYTQGLDDLTKKIKNRKFETNEY